MTSILDNIQTAAPKKLTETPVVATEPSKKENQNGSSFAAVIKRTEDNNKHYKPDENTVKSDSNNEDVAVSADLNGDEIEPHPEDMLTQSAHRLISSFNLSNEGAVIEIDKELTIELPLSESENDVNAALALVFPPQISKEEVVSSGNDLPPEGQIQPIKLLQQSIELASSEQPLKTDTRLLPEQIQQQFQSALTTNAQLNANQEKLQNPSINQVVNLATIPTEKTEASQLLTLLDKPNLKSGDISTVATKIESAFENPNSKQRQFSDVSQTFDIDKFESSALLKKNFSAQIAALASLSDVRSETLQTTTPVSATLSGIQSNPTNSTVDARIPSIMMQSTYKPGSNEWSETFARNIALMTMSKNNLAEIRMDPPELGSILVKISQTSNETNLQFQVQHGDTKAAIESSIQRLKESLAEQGFVNINVDIQHGEQSHSQDNDSQQSAQSSNEIQGLPVEEQNSLLTMQTLSSSGVDFFA